MAFTVHAYETSRFKQHLRQLGPGVPVTASEVRVYHLRKDGTKGRLLRISAAMTFEESPKSWRSLSFRSYQFKKWR
jgi:hypothetical protein